MLLKELLNDFYNNHIWDSKEITRVLTYDDIDITDRFTDPEYQDMEIFNIFASPEYCNGVEIVVYNK